MQERKERDSQNQHEEIYSQGYTTTFTINKKNGSTQAFDHEKIYKSLVRAVIGFESVVSLPLIMQEIIKNLYDKASTHDIDDALILATVSFVERDPAYSKVAARLLRQKLSKEVFGKSVSQEDYAQTYKNSFVWSIVEGVKAEIVDPRMLEFDLSLLADTIIPDRDDLFEYLGLRTLYERYFFRVRGKRTEMPQTFWMRVAMGLALLEKNKNEKAVEFYNCMSRLQYVPGTPTLLHAGSMHPQLSSCYLTTVGDDLGTIFKCLGDNAQMSRWSGGLANDWTPLRGTGAYIKSIKSGSQGIIPFLKIANDVTAAINRSGSRRGATVAYLEVWHYDFEDFLDLRRNTGDERRRTHDMNTASWIPDLFMKRVIDNGDWVLLSPDEAPDLHDLYGQAFEKRYQEYETLVDQGKIKLFKKMKAFELWRKLLTRLFETGHPWITFKDPCNIRSPQNHVGVIHSSNLCTEITLNTSSTETAVCNLGSVNVAQYVNAFGIDSDGLARVVKTAMRMLDNVIDINFYPTQEGKNSNAKHRPIGLGIMGFQDALFKMGICFSDKKALDFADELGEIIGYHAILASSELAQERGTYQTFKGSLWDQGIFPFDTLDLLEKERGLKIEVNRTKRLDWTPAYESVKKYGMRNSNTMAVAPTATIANIAGCFPCLEPQYKNLYVKANMGGEFTIINTYLVEDLKLLGLWNDEMLNLIKYYDGNINAIDIIPDTLKMKYKEAFDIDQSWLIDITAARGKWIDQSQSHNIFLRGTSGKQMDVLYKHAWSLGMKTTYYVRTEGASQIEKNTLDAKKFGYTQVREYTKVETRTVSVEKKVSCNLSSGELVDCEACQ